ncbi:hypothetical protein D9M69_643640 [compost metagenome]
MTNILSGVMESAIYSGLGILGASAITGLVLLSIKNPKAFFRLYVAMILLSIAGAAAYVGYALGFANGIKAGHAGSQSGLAVGDISTAINAVPFWIWCGCFCFMSVLSWAPDALGLNEKAN